MKYRFHVLVLSGSLCVGGVVAPYDVSAQTLAPLPVAPTFGTPTDTFGTAPAKDFTPSLGRIFADTVTDFRRLPSLDSTVILGMGGLTAMIGHPADLRISNSLANSQSAKGFFGAGEMMGAATTQLAGAFATYSIGRITGHPKLALIGADLVRAQFVSQTVTQAIKFSVGRTRPDGTSLSFPSGHTASAFATAAVLQRHLGWKAGIPAYAAAGYVAASRIQVKRHYLSDVAFGAAIGMMAGRTVTIGRGDARFAVAPVAAPGGAGVNFTWVGRK
jgi:membrane-associated phospholipid phosphatase